MAFQSTPNAERIHIAIYGRRNAGKSTLLNMLCAQEVSLVTNIAGTTSDPVHKAMELPGIGPVLFYDTAGFDDEGVLGEQRNDKTASIIEKSDLAILLFHDQDISKEQSWLDKLKQQNVPVICIYNLHHNQEDTIYQRICSSVQQELLCCDVSDSHMRNRVIESLTRCIPSDVKAPSIVGHLVKENDVIVLVMPQDTQAPKGRLILPQVQTIRDLLDHQCIIQCCTPSTFEQTLSILQKAPDLIITDSQVFKEVYAKKPKGSKLTSFSVLFARYKGNSDYFIEGAKAIATLSKDARILIAEACTHAPATEDIGRVKLPNLLRKALGKEINIEIVNGNDFPEDLSKYALIIHCGACMFHRTYVLSRIERAKKQGVLMSNYGMVLAYLQGILQDIEV